ncbi:MAG: TraX family protein [Cyanobacteria bacterium]|nr:TraX family protein [Cyanobacteria bacterium GSL.Bin1]
MTAASLMVLDHLGVVFDVEVFRLLGRLSFPLFAWLLIMGEQKTKNWQRYELRLLAMAVISQPLFVLFRETPFTANILFLLALALPCLRATSQKASGIFQLTSWLAATMIAEVGAIEYGAYGILLIYLLKSFPYLWQAPNSINYAGWVSSYLGLHTFSFLSYALQPFAGLFIFAVPFLKQVDQIGLRARWFYWFYPLHFLPLLLLKFHYAL